MLNSRFYVLKKPKPTYICYHNDSSFLGVFRRRQTHFKTKCLKSKLLIWEIDLILKQIVRILMLNVS